MLKSNATFFWLASMAAMFFLGVVSQGSGFIDGLLYYSEDIVYLSQQHLALSAISGGLAIVIGVPLGIWLSRPSQKRMADWFMQVLNIGTTIPTLAVLALSMSILGIGSTPAIFALCVATLLPIVRNTYVGILDVPEHLKEAAHGMGMTPFQTMIRVELTNALFVIFAGIRTALTINVGTVPLVFLIGGGGLGELIFTGIDLDEMPMLLAGAIPTAALAVMVDIAVGAIAFLVVPKGVNPLRMST